LVAEFLDLGAELDKMSMVCQISTMKIDLHTCRTDFGFVEFPCTVFVTKYICIC